MTIETTAPIDPAGMIDMTGRTAVVTGAASGIGLAIAEAYLRLGARVVAVDKDRDRITDGRAALGELAAQAEFVHGDVCREDDVSTIFDALAERSLDVLVNNVGDAVISEKRRFVDTDPESCDYLYDVNLRHLFLVTRAAIPRLAEDASVINVSTIEAFRAIPRRAVYSAFKAGVGAFTRSLALDLSDRRIRVNEIAPDTIAGTGQANPAQWIPEELQGNVSSWVPLGRFGRTSDVAGCAVFLATGLSAWVTGTTFYVDGGAMAAGQRHRLADGRWSHRPVITGDGYAAYRPIE